MTTFATIGGMFEPQQENIKVTGNIARSGADVVVSAKGEDEESKERFAPGSIKSDSAGSVISRF